MTIDDYVGDSNPPYVAVSSGENIATLRRRAKAREWRVWDVDAAGFEDVASVYRIFSEVLDFPVKGSKNWNAVNDMLSDLDWSPATGHLIALHNADVFSQKRPDDYATLIDVLESVGRHWHSWNDMKHPFKTVVFSQSRFPSGNLPTLDP